MTTKNNEIKNNYKNLNILLDEEINRINERKKELLLEKKQFDEQLFKGVKGYLYKLQNPLILNKNYLFSKFNLSVFIEELTKSEYLYKNFKNYYDYNFQVKDPKKEIDLDTINKYYKELEDELTATTILIKMLKIYINSNFQKNGLLLGSSNPKLIPNISIIFKNPILLLNHIENIQIKKFGRKMIEEYSQTLVNKEKTKQEIENLKTDIKSKLSLNTNENIELLKEYREILKKIDEELSEFQSIKTPLILKRTKKNN